MAGDPQMRMASHDDNKLRCVSVHVRGALGAGRESVVGSRVGRAACVGMNSSVGRVSYHN